MAYEWPLYGKNRARQELDSLNRLGAKGWEMIGYSTETRTVRDRNDREKQEAFHVFYLKRLVNKTKDKAPM